MQEWLLYSPFLRGMVKMLNDQDGLYYLFLKGLKNGKEIEEKTLITNIQQGIDPYKDYEAYLGLADFLKIIIY